MEGNRTIFDCNHINKNIDEIRWMKSKPYINFTMK